LDDEIAVQELGREVARRFQVRIAELEAANRAADLFLGSPRQVLYGDRPAMAVDFSKGKVIIFISRHSEEYDWPQVFDIKIVKIGRENEQ